MWGLGRAWILGTKAVCSGELQKLAVQSPMPFVYWKSGCPFHACLPMKKWAQKSLL